MKLGPLTFALVLGVGHSLGATGAGAQTPAPEPSTERTGSPYDANPACRERTVGGADPACVIQDGPPVMRQFGFGGALPKPAPTAPQTVQGAASPPVIIVVPPQGQMR